METTVYLIILLIEYFYELKEYIFILIIIMGLYYIWKRIINPNIKQHIRKKHMKFNEYGNLDKIEQIYEENEQLENEVETIQKRKFVEYEQKEILERLPISKILDEDNSFDAELFKKWSKNIFLYLQLGKENDLKIIKNSISETLFDRRIQVLKDFERDNIELKREGLLIEELKIYDYSKWMDKSQIKVFIKARLKEYIINKETKKVLRGNKRKTYERGFLMTFEKKDSNELEGFVRNCQSCGATIADIEFGTCQYCGSLVNPIRYNWKLIKYEVL